MAAPPRKAGLLQVSGADLKRFVVCSALLSLIDPVRGAPTRTSLDEDPEGVTPGGQQLKGKFLDSFALICSTSGSGAETASAVCLEQQHAPKGAILRVARNRGLTPRDLAGLTEVVQMLRLVAGKQKPPAQAEPEILRMAVELDRDRILSMAKKIEKAGFHNSLGGARSKLMATQRPEAFANPDLRLWLESCPFIMTAPCQQWSHATVAKLVSWASQARWSYPEQFQRLLGLDHRQGPPPWLDSLHKIARYCSAIKSMVKLAVKQPDVFADIRIEAIDAPDTRRFSLPGDSAHLLAAVQGLLVREDPGPIMEQLETRLGTHDVEAQLRKACSLNLTLHAEMQIVRFYEDNPSLKPRLRFIGTSKKACFLCHEYLLQHPLRLQVSACHQKIYPSWMLPPCHSALGGYKTTPFAKLSRRIEQLTRRELKTALAAPRRPRNKDSTAGPSLTRTATVPTGPGSWQLAKGQFGLHDGSLSQAW